MKGVADKFTVRLLTVMCMKKNEFFFNKTYHTMSIRACTN